jgi:peptide/nickel transport system substrate-binding protein
VIRHKVLALTGAGALAVALAACGSSNSSGSGDNTTSGTGSPWILGTTDTVTALDPAGSYDLGSSTLEYNLYQTLVTVPPNSTQIEGDAAKSCTYNNPKTLTCTLNPGEKFSNGDPLTSSDVKYSFERAIKIQDANGAAIYLLGSITTTAKDGTVTLNKGAIETPDDQTVVFHLDHPDTTFQYVLTYPGAAAIVDEDVFPADKKLPDDQIIGSGPYELSQYKAGEQAVLELNPNYSGPNQGKTGQVFVKYYTEPSALKLAVQNGEIDVAWRSLAPTDVAALKKDSNVTVATGKGSEIRYWVWNVGSGVGKQLAVRQAAAQVIDREAIAKDAYDNTVDPLYSIVPPGYGGQKDSFKEAYGAPNPGKAKQILQAAGISTPVGGMDAHPLRTEHRGRGERAPAPARGEWTVQGQPEEHRVGAVPDHLQAGRLRPVDPRLVPRLPGRRRLPVAVHGRRWLLPERVQEPAGGQARRPGAGHQ